MEYADDKELRKKIIVNLLFTLGIFVFLLVILPKMFLFFMPLIIAWIIAGIANPLVQFLEKKVKIVREHGSVFVIILILLLLGGLIYLLGYFLFCQISSFMKDFPTLYAGTIDKLQDSLKQLHGKFDFLPANVQEILGKNNEKLKDFAMSLVGSMKSTKSISAVSDLASSIIDGFVLIVLTLMMSYFFVAKRENIKIAVQKAMPREVKDFWKMCMDTCFTALAGYLKACFKIGIVVFFILWFIFGAIMKMEYAVILALVTSFLDFWPFLGTGIIIGPWGVYCAITGEYVNVIILIVAYVICLLAHRLLEPKLIGDSVGMSPFATLISMFICYRLIGMLGLIVGIPIGMIIIAFYKEGVFESQIRGIKILFNDINKYRKY